MILAIIRGAAAAAFAFAMLSNANAQTLPPGCVWVGNVQVCTDDIHRGIELGGASFRTSPVAPVTNVGRKVAQAQTLPPGCIWINQTLGWYQCGNDIHRG